MRDGTYVVIQSWMPGLGLSGNELIIYAVVYGFSQDGETWFTGSRAYLAEWCRASKSTVSRNLDKLVSDGLLERRERVIDGCTYVDYRASDVFGENGGGYPKCVPPLPKMGTTPTQNAQGGVPKMSTHNIEDKDRHKDREIYRRVIAHLNDVCGTNYRDSTAKTQSLISARIREGFTADDFEAVIDRKAAQWLGDHKMSRYLRPETLFGTKFEGYLNETEKGVRRDVGNGYGSSAW